MPFQDLRKRHVLWLGLAAVLVPLAILLGLQYRWLVELEETSTIARRATLDNYLQAVVDWNEVRYQKIGERLLTLPPWIFEEDRLEKAPKYFYEKLKKEAPAEWGVQDLFVVSLTGDRETVGRPLFYRPPGQPSYDQRRVPRGKPYLQAKPWDEEVRAVYVATAPWETLARKGGEVDAGLVVDERDPRYRMLLNPVTDDASRVVGLVGAVLDPEAFQANLPKLLEKTLPEFFPEASLGPGTAGPPGARAVEAPGVGDLVVWVRDRQGEVRYATGGLEDVPPPVRSPHAPGGEAPEGPEAEWAEKPFSFVFTDWSAGVTSRQATAGQWARTNFELNVALSAVVALVLLGGVVLALTAASRAMRLSQMKSDFVSNVSHELRTPLASVRVFGELLRLGRVEGEAKVREYGEFIETESRRLTQLINNLLDFSSIESGRKSYRFEPADLEEVVTETLETFGVRLRQAGFRLTYEGPDQPLPPVAVDPGALAQSLSNLVDNAVKYSDGSSEIQVTVERRGGEAVISVRDWGVGIPKDEQDKIFERFHRVSTGLVHDVKGSGLGLAIVQHVVQAHGGEVTVESRPGQGSTFSLHLPLETRGEERRDTSGAPGVLGEEPA